MCLRQTWFSPEYRRRREREKGVDITISEMLGSKLESSSHTSRRAPRINPVRRCFPFISQSSAFEHNRAVVMLLHTHTHNGVLPRWARQMFQKKRARECLYRPIDTEEWRVHIYLERETGERVDRKGKQNVTSSQRQHRGRIKGSRAGKTAQRHDGKQEIEQ
jgi:hypothetical protein